MTFLKALCVASVATALALPVAAQDQNAITTADEVRAEISEAMDAIVAYTEQERDQAVTEAREALNRLDAEIDQREQAARENWAEMSEAARETADARLKDLRQARNRLGERYGALESSADNAWDELKTGFSDSWNDFSEAWSVADKDAAAN